MGTEAQAAVSVDTCPATRKTVLRVFILLLTSFLVMIAAAASATLYGTSSFWQRALRDEFTRDLMQKAQMFAARVNSDRSTKITDLTSQTAQQAGARATVVAANGKVLADSQISPDSLENEGQRPEFVAALRGETGIETRSRGAFGIPVLYVAVPVSGVAVRLACSLSDLDIAGEAARKVLLAGCAVAVVAAFIISALTARVVSR
jgi:two-component system, OmpR family, phosphate regulon sensor histidine kinase PhoR